MSRLRVSIASILIVIIALAASGCAARASVEYIPEGGTYVLADLEDVARSVDLSVLEDVAPEAISDERKAYLTDLRGNGAEAGAIADTLTRDFPLDTAAVPLHVESAIVDGRPVWLIIEAWAEEDGPLTHRRVWLLDHETLELVDSLSIR